MKLSDFGLSAELQNSIAMCATFVGTFKYMSPERIKNQSYGQPADVWSLGKVVVWGGRCWWLVGVMVLCRCVVGWLVWFGWFGLVGLVGCCYCFIVGHSYCFVLFVVQHHPFLMCFRLFFHLFLFVYFVHFVYTGITLLECATGTYPYQETGTYIEMVQVCFHC